MSVEAIAAVWRMGELTPLQRLVLLAIADHAAPDGTAFPSVATIAGKIGCQPRAVKANLRQLERAGRLLVVRRGGGRTPGGRPRSTTYRIPLQPDEGAAYGARGRTVEPRNGARRCTLNGAPRRRSTVHGGAPEPPLNHHPPPTPSPDRAPDGPQDPAPDRGGGGFCGRPSVESGRAAVLTLLGGAGVRRDTAEQLAGQPGVTPERARAALELAREKSGIQDPAGYAVALLRAEPGTPDALAVDQAVAELTERGQRAANARRRADDVAAARAVVAKIPEAERPAILSRAAQIVARKHGAALAASWRRSAELWMHDSERMPADVAELMAQVRRSNGTAEHLAVAGERSADSRKSLVS